MVFRKEIAESVPSIGREAGDHFGRVTIILGSAIPALEEELEFGSDVGHTARGSQHGVLPGDPNDGIASKDPAVLIAVPHGDVEAPWPSFVLPAPQVVLVFLDTWPRSVPRGEDARSGDSYVPAWEHPCEGGDTGPENADVEVVMGSP
jgi:hypothetical protein